MNKAFDTHFSCVACLAAPALKGAVVGAVAALPLLLLPEALAGVGAVATAGLLFGGSGAIGYSLDWLLDGADPQKWSWPAFGASVALPMFLGPAARYGVPGAVNSVKAWRPSAPPTALPEPSAVPVAEPGVSAPPSNPTAYSVAHEMQLNPADFGRSRTVHFNRANASLDRALQSDPEFASSMDQLIPGVQSSVSSVGGRSTPNGWTWEHASSSTAQGRLGVMRLVPSEQHTPGSPWWRVLHPDPGAAGGYSEWAIPAGAPSN